MLEIKTGLRKEFGRKVKRLRKKGLIPAILYGPKIENLALVVDKKEFERVYREVGESSLVKLLVMNGAQKEFLVLIKDVSYHPLTEDIIHIDFYQPLLEEQIEVTVPLIFEGEAPAVKELGGTLVKNISEIEIKALPQNLPSQIKVDISKLKTFDDYILVKDLVLPKGVKILRKPEEILASVASPEEIEEELEKKPEKELKEVEVIKEKKKEKEEEK